MVAAAQHREQRRRDRRESRRQQRDRLAGRTIERTDGVLQRLRRGRPAPAVLIASAMGEEIFRARVEQRGGVVDGRIDVAMMGEGIAPAGGEQRVGLELARRLVVGILVHGSSCTVAGVRTAAAAFTSVRATAVNPSQPLDLDRQSF